MTESVAVWWILFLCSRRAGDYSERDGGRHGGTLLSGVSLTVFSNGVLCSSWSSCSSSSLWLSSHCVSCRDLYQWAKCVTCIVSGQTASVRQVVCVCSCTWQIYITGCFQCCHHSCVSSITKRVCEEIVMSVCDCVLSVQPVCVCHLYNVWIVWLGCAACVWCALCDCRLC